MGTFCLLLLIVSGFRHITSKAEVPKVVIIVPSDQIIKEGFYFEMQCLYNNRYTKYSWYKDNQSFGNNSFTFSGTADPRTGGSYSCRVGWWAKYRRSEPLNVVTVAADPTLTLEVKPQYPLLGDTIFLECLLFPLSPFGISPFQWYQHNDLIRESVEKRISIESAKMSDAASYRCELNAKYRKWVSKTVNISVTDLCSTPILKVEPEIEVFVGQQLHLTCLAEQFQVSRSLLYTFFKNEKPLDVPSVKDYYQTGPALLGDSGLYRCEVTTSKSARKKLSNEAPVFVKPIPVSKPDLETHPGTEILAGATMSLICSVSTGSTPITYFIYDNSSKNIYRKTSNHTKMIYEIANVRKYAAGHYSCSVSNQASQPALYSESVEIAVTVPVAGAFLASNVNKSEISVGERLVLQCQLKVGTSPYFRWYLNHQQVANISEYYNFSTDGSQLNIHSFQIHHKGRYQCTAINRGPGDVTFNTTSNYIDITTPVQGNTTAIVASIPPLLLVTALLACLCFKSINKEQETSITQQDGGTSGNRSQNTNEEAPESKFEYAVVGRCRTFDSSHDQSTYFTAQDNSAAADGIITDAALVYSVAMMTRSRNAGSSNDTSGMKQESRKDMGDYCVTYATLNLKTTEDSLEGDQVKEWGVYENFPRRADGNGE
ncbi:Fc receptor-like protein 2 [Scyliorhinus torazame]|uniref:Fc receptor-like protein 2 n=1 Tax=Scyliorhinus torazame TaxID=75743 RepID=UPI003B5BA11C